MTRKVALFGGSFNPPATHHRRIAEELAQRFDEVIVIPCGPRPDKPEDIEPTHRAVLTDLTFRDIPKVRVDLSDLENDVFTRTHELDERYRVSCDEVWHVVGTDLIKGGADGASDIQTKWQNGDALWSKARFAVISRDGYEINSADLPPHCLVFNPGASGSSSEIRRRVPARESTDGLVVPEAAAYIKRCGLYLSKPPSRTTDLAIDCPRIILVVDDQNPQALKIAEPLKCIVSEQNPNCIVVIGGDGTMLSAIEKHWRKRLPFLGINAGHRGYFCNEPAELDICRMPWNKMKVERLPLLHVEYQPVDTRGNYHQAHAFNDAWVERASGQAAWLELEVNGKIRIPKLVSDGALVATAAGSSAYAMAMGGPLLDIDEPGFLLIGSNPIEPRFWKWATLKSRWKVSIKSLDLAKRPVRMYVDGQNKGTVTGFKAWLSRVAAVELMFAPDHDISTKRERELFPPQPQHQPAVSNEDRGDEGCQD